MLEIEFRGRKDVLEITTEHSQHKFWLTEEQAKKLYKELESYYGEEKK